MGDPITEDETGTFAEALLNAGAKVGGRDDLLKSTALGWACRWGHVTVARLMFEYGADPVEGDADAKVGSFDLCTVAENSPKFNSFQRATCNRFNINHLRTINLNKVQ
jgi:ankyrin repeat protein